ncbi:hypothetical protein [Delftia sp. UME58]|nr:hypothetical protein [Delftia sp. UME58]
MFQFDVTLFHLLIGDDWQCFGLAVRTSGGRVPGNPESFLLARTDPAQ